MGEESRREMTDKEYCGFVCSDYVEKARQLGKEMGEIWKAVGEFAQVNPEEAEVVRKNVMNAFLGNE